ncbi:MAG TPA: ribosome silencing factor [Aminivibrio sp.]|uniref:ribosome silencing factor n=2 Tax=Aminivibrio sp. TaxID=1872489 RepID=UPI002B67DCC5|nr:ribosome silencing factor [Synergistaceae bacterium]NCB16506.1 ribosome silencing factor [Synergistales bacterium]HRX25206.1 ribosome silencing factor [Aminivibrio sp.]
MKKENRLREFEYLYNALADKRGLDIVAMDMEGSAAISDTFVLVTANSEIHMGTLRDAALEAFHTQGMQTTVEGYDSSQWRLIDAGEVVVHVFSRAGRDHYKLEKLWGDAPTFNFTYED